MTPVLAFKESKNKKEFVLCDIPANEIGEILKLVADQSSVLQVKIQHNSSTHTTQQQHAYNTTAARIQHNSSTLSLMRLWCGGMLRSELVNEVKIAQNVNWK